MKWSKAQRALTPLMPVLRRAVLPLALACAASVVTIDAQAAELTFSLRIENGSVPEKMRWIRIQQGDVVRLLWSVDQPVLLHLHGYDIERKIEPASVGEMTFTARATGRFPIHAHTAGARADGSAREEAPLVTIEVYPR
jgi:hypothetical protein